MDTSKKPRNIGRVYKIWGFLFLLLFLISLIGAIASMVSGIITVILLVGGILMFAIGDLIAVLSKIEWNQLKEK